MTAAAVLEEDRSNVLGERRPGGSICILGRRLGTAAEEAAEHRESGRSTARPQPCSTPLDHPIKLSKRLSMNPGGPGPPEVRNPVVAFRVPVSVSPQRWLGLARGSSISETSAASDTELVSGALAGSQDAYRDLVARFQRPIFSLIVRMVRDRPLAEDLTQEVFVKAFRALSTYDHRRKFSSWLFKIAHNATIDHLRKGQLQTVPLEDPTSEGADWVDQNELPMEAIFLSESGIAASIQPQRAKIEVCIRKIPIDGGDFVDIVPRSPPRPGHVYLYSCPGRGPQLDPL